MSCTTEKVIIKGEETLFDKEDEQIIEKSCAGYVNKSAKSHNGIYVKIMD